MLAWSASGARVPGSARTRHGPGEAPIGLCASILRPSRHWPVRSSVRGHAHQVVRGDVVVRGSDAAAVELIVEQLATEEARGLRIENGFQVIERDSVAAPRTA